MSDSLLSLGAVLVFALQGLLLLVDEAHFHRRRGLPQWEIWGHPLDTLSVALAFGYLVLAPLDQDGSLVIYALLAISSCLMVTKDEWVHARVCSGAEQWIHAMLFTLHPLVLIAAGLLSARGLGSHVLRIQLGLLITVAIAQWVYWSFLHSREPRPLETLKP